MEVFLAIISIIIIFGVIFSNFDSVEDIEPSRGLVKFGVKTVYGLFTDTKRTLIKLAILFGAVILLAISGLAFLANL
ncbi:hypothetical protein [Paenisporosarcina sp. NPDC076898]|uniref:hypothetical protein n=1 Tax=unclassified Paenisporosarcina TaxID=2642018 RepID=UPI003D05218F